ncbi:hypothetical protein HMI54_011718, partial [Coelomomyces lativittatus]
PSTSTLTHRDRGRERDRDRDRYQYHRPTRCSWTPTERPFEMSSPFPGPLDPTEYPWVRIGSSQGKMYYYNIETGISQWSKP